MDIVGMIKEIAAALVAIAGLATLAYKIFSKSTQEKIQDGEADLSNEEQDFQSNAGEKK